MTEAEAETPPAVVEDEKPLPRGAARIPLWWMEITPHNVLDLEEDKRRRGEEEKEARAYAELAAKDDYVQQYGEGGTDYDPSQEGNHGSDAADWRLKGGYQRGNAGGGQWKSAYDSSKKGRQFKPGHTPQGYQPGRAGGEDVDENGNPLSHRPAGSGGFSGRIGDSGLRTAGKYGDKNVAFSQPSWTTIKLRSTSTGGAIRKGQYKQKTFHDNGAAKSASSDKQDKDSPEPTEQASPKAAVQSSQPEDGAVPAEKEEDEEKKEGVIGGFVKRVRRKKVTKRKSTRRVADDHSDDGVVATTPTSTATIDDAAEPAKSEAAPAASTEESPPVTKTSTSNKPTLKPVARAAPPPEAAKTSSEPAWARIRRERAERLAKEAETGTTETAAAAPAPSESAPVDPAPAESPPVESASTESVPTESTPKPVPEVAAIPEITASPSEEVAEEEQAEEEVYSEEEYFSEEDYEDDEFVEEIIIEDGQGNDVKHGDEIDMSTHDVTALQTALAKKANEMKLLEEQMNTTAV